MRFRFKFTAGFLVISVVIFGLAAVVITQSARRNEEASLISVVSQQSNRDARVIATVITGMTSARPAPPALGAASDAPSAGGNSMDALTMATFLQNSNIVRLSLYDSRGQVVWSSSDSAGLPSNLRPAFKDAVMGMTVTGLSKNVGYYSVDGSLHNGDITSTFVPLFDSESTQPAQVLEVARDVTATLSARINSARSSMFQTVFGTLGGSFVVLFGVVLTADVLVRRSRQRAVSQERALADERIVASRLEMENQQLRQMNEERDRFLSMVSHELRTPLTAILGFTDVLTRRQTGEQKEKNVKHLELMRRNGEHLNTLIEEMLEITRIESGRFEIEKQGFSVDQLLEQVRESGRMMLMGRDQTLRIEKPVEKTELYGDRRRVMQVMLNLLSNASKYSPRGSTVTLVVKIKGESLEIGVGDEGAGIPKEECELLFNTFYRRDDEVTRGQSGLGLGLSIVKSIVDAHHGAIEVNSVVGAGTVMKVSLPNARRAPVSAVAPSPEIELEMKRLHRMRDLRAVPARSASVA